jgi:hypothetical protein
MFRVAVEGITQMQSRLRGDSDSEVYCTQRVTEATLAT